MLNNTVELQGRMKKARVLDNQYGRIVLGNITQRDEKGSATVTMQVVAYDPKVQAVLQSLSDEITVEGGYTPALIIRGRLETRFDKRPAAVVGNGERFAPQTRITVDEVVLAGDL